MLKNQVIKGIVNGTILLVDIQNELRSDKEVVMAAVKQSGWAYFYCVEKW